MGVELKVPTLGESITEATVGKWHKKVGESVNVDEPVVVLETDKVTVDVPAPAGGSIEQISAKEGDIVKVGQVIGSIAAGAGATAVSKTQAPAPAPSEKKQAPASSSGSSNVEAFATPVAKRVAEDKGIDVSQVQGSGAAGRVMKQDVLGYQAPAVNQARPSAPTRTGPRPRADVEERVRMTPLRKRVAERLLEAQSTAAMLTTFNEVDMGDVMALRKRYADKFLARHGVKLGFMSFFVRAAIEALKAFPQVNAEIEGEEVVFKKYYDLGVAVSGSRGLMVPVLRNADHLTMAEIEKNIAELGNKARTDKLKLEDLQGGTFTISNGGIFGSMLSTPILNSPQVGILGMHNIVDRAVVRDGAIVIRPVMFLALTYDHRLIDGREAVQFLVRVKECIEDPERLLLEV